MIVHHYCTANLGDFLNCMPVLSGVARAHGPITLIVRPEMRKFNGIREFLQHQDHIVSDVLFMDEIDIVPSMVHLSSWTREDKNNSIRPTETCRYENWMRDHYPSIHFEVDDQVELKVADLPDIRVPKGFIVGDRANHSPDPRRAVGQLSHLSKNSEAVFLDYKRPMMENAYIIKHSPRPFVSCFTGVSILADLINKADNLVVWKPEDYAEEFRRGPRQVCWDNKTIEEVFQKHYYGDRKSKLVHNEDLGVYL